MSEDIPELSPVARAVVAGETIAAMVTTPEGRDFLREVVARLQPSVMSIPFTDLVRERLRADRLIAIVDAVAGHGAKATDTRPLGEIMPQLPEDVRALIADHIIAAGWQ